MNILGHHYIGGKRSAAGSPLYSVNAVTAERYPVSFHDATEAEVDAAAQAAERAFQAFRATCPAARATLLESIAEEIDALGDDFIAEASLPPALRDANPWNLTRLVDGESIRKAAHGKCNLEAAA